MYGKSFSPPSEEHGDGPYEKMTVSQTNVLLVVTLLQDMWLGVLHHVVGEHEWHDGQSSNGPLASSESDKPFLEKGSKAMEAL